MTSHAHQPDTFRPGPLAARVVVGAVCGALLGLGIAYAAGWAEPSVLLTATGLAAGTWLAGSILGVVVLVIASGRTVSRLGPGVLSGSSARMLVALFGGLLLYFVLKPNGHAFWTSFLLAGFGALIAESTWAIRIMNAARVTPAAGAR